ncbi:MAG: hypothetical protein ABI234_05745 [Ktedonobacteraceae bacterium]
MPLPPLLDNIPTAQETPWRPVSTPQEQSSFPRSPQLVPTQPRSLADQAGFIIAGIGGIVGLLSFFTMPYLSYGFLSATGQQLASFGYQTGSQYGNSYGYGSSQPQANELVFFWLLPIVAGIIILMAGVPLLKSGGTGKKGAAGGLIVLGVLAIVGLLGTYIYINVKIQNLTFSSLTINSVIGSGIWVYIIAMIAVIIGGVIQTKASQ